MIWIFISYYALLMVSLFGWVWWSGQFNQALSLALGSILSGILFLLSYKGWRGIFEKKFVALSALIIVIKYAILVFFVYFLSQLTWIYPGWLIGGVAAFKLPLFIMAIQYAQRQRQNGSF